MSVREIERCESDTGNEAQVKDRYEKKEKIARRGGQQVLRRPLTLAVVDDGIDWRNGGDRRIVEKSRPKPGS